MQIIDFISKIKNAYARGTNTSTSLNNYMN